MAKKKKEENAASKTDAFTYATPEQADHAMPVTDPEEALRNSERRYKALIENSKDAVALTDTERRITYISPVVKTMLGYEPEELIGRTSYDVFMDPAEVGQNLAFRQSLKPGQMAQRTIRVRHKDGSWRWIETEATNYLDDPAIGAMLTNFRDITERKKVEEALQNSEKRFRSLIENGKDGIALTGPDRLFTYLGPQVKNILGFEPEELVGTHPLELYHPDDHQRIFTFVEGIKDKNVSHTISDLRIRRKDGSWIWAELTFCDQLDDPAVNALVCNFRDTTTRKNAEDALAQLNQSLEKKVEERTAQLQESNKALESFSYMAAHDLQAPLRVLSGYATILKKDYGTNLNEDGSKLLDTIVLKTRYMSKLISDMLTFSRASHAVMNEEKVYFDEMVRGIADQLSLAAGMASIEIQILDLGYASCDAGLIEQVWINLISNAIKYSAKKEKSLIEVGYRVSGSENIYYVKDNGAGFDMKYSANLFEVFKRMHSADEFEGTGIGLALVKSIITRHRGRVWADAEVDKGATFYFALPHAGTE